MLYFFVHVIKIIIFYLRHDAENNKHILSCIIEVVKLCGMQSIALRGHRGDKVTFGDHDDKQNHGNFIAILKQISKHDPVLKAHFEKNSKRERYLSKTIQTQIIAVIKQELTERLILPLEDCRYYSIMVDEVTDASNTEVMALCIRFLDIRDPFDIEIKEVSFYYLEYVVYD